MLKYKLYKDTRSTSQFKGCWYARVAKRDIITTKQLVEHMAKHGTAYSKGTMWAVITDMIGCIHELILRGQAVKIDDLAIFSIGIESKPAPTVKDFAVRSNIATFKLRVRATGGFTKAQLKRVARIKEATYYQTVAKTSGSDGE